MLCILTSGALSQWLVEQHLDSKNNHGNSGDGDDDGGCGFARSSFALTAYFFSLSICLGHIYKLRTYIMMPDFAITKGRCKVLVRRCVKKWSLEVFAINWD